MKKLYIILVFALLLFSCNNQERKAWEFEKFNSKANRGLEVEEINNLKNKRFDLDSNFIDNKLSNTKNNDIINKKKECTSACCSKDL